MLLNTNVNSMFLSWSSHFSDISDQLIESNVCKEGVGDKLVKLLSSLSIHFIFIWQFELCRNITNGETSPFTDFIVAVLSGLFCKPFSQQICILWCRPSLKVVLRLLLSTPWSLVLRRLYWWWFWKYLLRIETSQHHNSQFTAVSGGSVGDKPARKSYQTNQCSKC